MGEFDLIARHFNRATGAASVAVGIGDDGAVLAPSPGRHLVAAVDTLVAGVHFPTSTSAHAVGHKALAVNLSDLAAMGAVPRWALLALTLPEADDGWLREFAEGFFALATRHAVALVGGDTTRGPSAVTVQLLGEVAPGAALTRAGARPGDEIWVSGSLGDAALALRRLNGEVAGPRDAATQRRLDYPTPRCELGVALVGTASAAIDLSDGLLADLGHVLVAGGIGATIDAARVPLSPAVAEFLDAGGDPDLVYSGGDDYELCFTVPPSKAGDLGALSSRLGVALQRIGIIESAPGLRLIDQHGARITSSGGGYDHFRD